MQTPDKKMFFGEIKTTLLTPSDRPFHTDASNWHTHSQEIEGNWLPASFKGIFNSEKDSAEQTKTYVCFFGTKIPLRLHS
jgi:hypothetical protein